MSKKLDPIGKSSTGLDENIAAMVSGIFGWLTGIIFYFIESSSKYVKFHAMQNVVAFGILSIATVILGYLPFIGNILTSLLGLASFVLWVFMLIKTYQGEWVELPVVSDLAKQLGKIED